MKKITRLTILLLLTAFTSFAPAADYSRFYRQYNDALSISVPALKVERFLQLLEAYPEKAAELDLIISTSFKGQKITQPMKQSAENLLKQHGGIPAITAIALKFIPEEKTQDDYRTKFFSKCDFSALTSVEWQSVVQIVSKHTAYHIRNNSCLNAGAVIYRPVSALPDNLAPEIRFELLYHALFLFWNGAWEEHCSAANFDRWQTLPATGCKKYYDETLNKLIVLEEVLPFPESVALLQVYNTHCLKRSGIYAKKISGSRNGALREQIYESAFVSKDRKLLSLVSKLENSTFGAFVLTMYFDDPSKLDKFFQPQEVQLIRAVWKKEYQTAEKHSAGILASGTISSPWVVRAMLDMIWYTKNQTMLRQIAKAVNKDSKKFLLPSIANALAYNFAVQGIELDQAEKLLKSALNAEPKNPAYLDSMAYLLYRKKRFKQARSFIRLALKFANPAESQSTILLHAAEIELAATKNKDAAREYLRKAKLAAKSEDSEFDYARAGELTQELAK